MKSHAVPRVLLCSALLAILAPFSLGALSWSDAPFSHSAAEVAAAAAQVKPGDRDAVAVLYEEDAFSFDAAGAAVHTFRITYKIFTKDGIERWSTASCYWQPWRQNRPEIRARVVSADGAESFLDPNTVAESTAWQADPDVYTDERVLDAPLPSLATGCVVEYTIVTTDRAPLLDAGSVVRIWFGHGEPVRQRRLLIDCPSSLSLRWVVRGSETLRGVREEAGGRVRARFEAADAAAIREREEYLTTDAVEFPCVDFSTGRSWNDVARAYAAVSAGMADGAPVARYAAEVTGAAGQGRATLIANLLYRIQQGVRYTGINFGENAIVPHSPLDTLKHGYGDCKDKAFLLVAALDALGIQARVALLMAGGDPDVPSDLAGFGLFNHAIVYLPADGIWMDPTADFTRPGELPLMDQGRRALVIASDTTGLVVTPEDAAALSLLHEVREYRLSESGPAAVTETTTVTGSIEAGYRDHYARATPAQTREEMEKYVKRAYEAKALGRMELSDPAARDGHFTMTLEASEARVGDAEDSSAVVYLRAGPLFDYLPSLLTAEDDPVKPFARKNPLRLWQPYVSEYEYRIFPPVGFRAAALPEDEARDMGPALLTKTFKLQPDGSVTAIFRFDCGKRVYSAEESAALHKEVRAVMDGEASTVAFEQVGQSLLAAGRYKEALEEFHSLAGQHPTEALHRIQASAALLAAGFRDDALVEARAAVDLEPKLARAHTNLAWVELHDPFGRLLAVGAQVAEARVEYGRAASLDPSDTLPTFNLAILDEYNEALVRYGPGAALDQAVTRYRSLAKSLKGTDSWTNVGMDLLYLKRFRELKEELKDPTSNSSQQALAVAASAVLDGPAAAQREAARIATSPEARRNVLAAAAQFLLAAQRYPESAELMMASARGASSLTEVIAFAEKVKTLVPVDPSRRDLSTPRGLLLAVLATVLFDTDAAAAAETYFAASMRPLLADPDGRKQFAQSLDDIRGSLGQTGLPANVMYDFLSVFLKIDTVSEGAAMAALVTMPDVPSYTPTVFYLKQESGGCRLLGTDTDLVWLGHECMAALEAGAADQAAQWMRLVQTQHDRRAGFPNMSADPMFMVLPKGINAASPIRLAAAMALARSDDPRDASLGASILLPAWRAEKVRTTRLALARTLATALAATGRQAELLEVTDWMVMQAPYDVAILAVRAVALDRAGNSAEGDRLVRYGLFAEPGDLSLTRLLEERLAGRGEYAEAMRLVNTIIDSGKGELADYNALAWYSLYLGVPDPALIESRQIVSRLMNGNAALLHTLACVLGDSGRMLEAQEVFGKYLGQRGGSPPDAATWLAYGILAERFGLRETALRALGSVAHEPGNASGTTSYALAQIHLGKMTGEASRPAALDPASR